MKKYMVLLSRVPLTVIPKEKFDYVNGDDVTEAAVAAMRQNRMPPKPGGKIHAYVAHSDKYLYSNGAPSRVHVIEFERCNAGELSTAI